MWFLFYKGKMVHENYLLSSFIFGALFSSARIGYSIASRSIQAIGYARNEDYGRLALLSCELIEIQRIKNLNQRASRECSCPEIINEKRAQRLEDEWLARESVKTS